MKVAEYVDDGKTGTKLAGRDALARCLIDAENGRFQILVVRALDRLTRSGDLLERLEIIGRLKRAHVLIAIADTGEITNLDQGTDELLTLITTWVAADETRRRLEASRRGKIEAIRKGRKPARRGRRLGSPACDV